MTRGAFGSVSSLRRSRSTCTSILRSKTSSWIRVACRRCSRESGRCGASRNAISNAYSPLVSARDSVGISEAAVAPIELPAAKSATASFRVALDGCPPAQHRPDAREKFSQTERLGDVVVGAQFQPDNPVDLVATMTRGDDHGNIGAGSALAEQIAP